MVGGRDWNQPRCPAPLRIRRFGETSCCPLGLPPSLGTLEALGDSMAAILASSMATSIVGRPSALVVSVLAVAAVAISTHVLAFCGGLIARLTDGGVTTAGVVAV